MSEIRNRGNKPELLAPCGSYEALSAALEAGADAVYFGGTLFNARMNAKNFSREEIVAAASSCRAHGVRSYVTVNTQIYDREIEQALEYIAFLTEAGVDALILADVGLAEKIREFFPNLELHASTQMTVHNIAGADRLYKSGFRRVVAARELTEENISLLCKKASPEIEVFVHGALCVSCSGQCLMSSMLGGRSGNRGECAQPCRMSYNGGYPLSLKDMCLAEHIPALLAAGVASLKIEGRRKSPGYVYGVTKIYRRLLDEERGATRDEMEELKRLFSRGGFTDGYFTGDVGEKMLGVRSGQDVEMSRKSQNAVLSGRNGPTVGREASNDRPTGSKAEAKEGEEKGQKKRYFAQKLAFPPKRPPQKPITTARFRSASQIPDSHDFTHVYLPLSAYQSVADGVLLPPVIFDSAWDEVRKKLEAAASAGAKHLLVGNIGQLSLAEEFGLIPHGDFRLNTFNTFSGLFWAREGKFESLLLSCELILPQIRDIVLPEGVRKGAVVYGRLPLMLLQKPVGKAFLRDTRGAVFPVLREEGRDTVYNSVPLYMADQTDRLDRAGIEERHMIFSDEKRGDVMKVLYSYAHGTIPKENIRRLK